MCVCIQEAYADNIADTVNWLLIVAKVTVDLLYYVQLRPIFF